ncbi:hypothetical protein JW948_17295 [bacterium]|nr:hypothetical protein [bacterium]
MDISLVQDNNVFEALDNSDSDQSGRFMLSVSGACLAKKMHRFDLNYSGGLEGYQHYTRENRTVHHGSLSYLIQPFRFGSLGASVQGRTKKFFRSDRGYEWMRAEWSALAFLPWGVSVRGYSSWTSMNHRLSGWFDFTSRADGVRVQCRIMPELKCIFQYHTELEQYDRIAYGLDSQAPNQYIYLPKLMPQKNLIREITTGVEWTRGLICRLNFTYTWQVSNSYGYDYEKPGIEGILVRTLPWSLTLRCYTRYQSKSYSEPVQSAMQINPDSETDENRQILCDLIRDLPENRSVRIRLGLYRNESPLRDLYYDKMIWSAGISQSF